MDSNYDQLREAVIHGNEDAAVELVRKLIDDGIEPKDLLAKGLLRAMNEVGRLWEENYFFLPDIILAADAFKAAMSELEPSLDSEEYYRGKVVIGTVKGDLHDLGKNIVVAVLKGAGFEVVDLGIDVDLDEFLIKTRELKPDVLAVGAYLSSTIGEITNIIQALEESGLRSKVKIIIGGICTSQEYADQVGADLWGKDALDAASKISRVISEPATRKGS